MSTRKLTLKTEKSTRASDPTQVIATQPKWSTTLYPKRIYLDNGEYIVWANSSGDNDMYLNVNSSDNFIMANLENSGEVQLWHTMSGGTQRYLLFKEYASTNHQAIQMPNTVYIVTENGDIHLLPADDIFVKTYERHIQIPALLTGNPSQQPTSVSFFTVGGLQFATNGTKYAYCQWELPDDWDGGDMYFEVDWFPDSGAMSGPDVIKWDVEYAAVAEGESHGATSKTVSATNVDANTQYYSVHSRVTLAYNDATQPLTKQDHIYFKISRDTAVPGDFAGTVTVPAFEIIYNSIQIPRGN